MATSPSTLQATTSSLTADERDAMLRDGATSLSDQALLSLVLPGSARDSLRLAQTALLEAGTLRSLLDMPVEQLGAVDGFGPDQVTFVTATRELGRRYVASSIQRGDPLQDPRAMGRFFTAKLRHNPYEVFACLFLDARHRVLAYEELARGSVDGCRVHAREVVKRALHHNAAACVFAHNHPSGVAEPSHADRMLTQELVAALSLVEVRVLDHVVVGEGQVASFVERGLLP